MEKCQLDPVSNDDFLKKLSEAQSSNLPYGSLDKRGVKDFVKGLGPDFYASVQKLGKRAIFHVGRLVAKGRSQIEHDFGFALGLYAGNVMDNRSSTDRNKAVDHISGESLDSCLWWTLSPYVFNTLSKRKGSEEAVRLLIEWAESGESIRNSGDRVTLEGLDRYNVSSPSNRTFILSRNEYDASHELAREEAERLVSEGVFGDIDIQIS